MNSDGVRWWHNPPWTSFQRKLGEPYLDDRFINMSKSDLLQILLMVSTDMLRNDFASEEDRREYVRRYVQVAIDTATKNAAIEWTAFSQNDSLKSGFYWLKNSMSQKILAHLSVSKEWHAMDAHGQSFKITDAYTHWSAVVEPIA